MPVTTRNMPSGDSFISSIPLGRIMRLTISCSAFVRAGSAPSEPPANADALRAEAVAKLKSYEK